jgi:hypothetical protein
MRDVSRFSMIKIETNVGIRTEITEPETTVSLLDNVLCARDALFEVKLSDGLSAHRKLIDLLPK